MLSRLRGTPTRRPDQNPKLAFLPCNKGPMSTLQTGATDWFLDLESCWKYLISNYFTLQGWKLIPPKVRVRDLAGSPDTSARTTLLGPDSPVGSGGRGRFATPSGPGRTIPLAPPPTILRQKASGSPTPVAGSAIQAGCSPCQPGREKTPERVRFRCSPRGLEPRFQFKLPAAATRF